MENKKKYLEFYENMQNIVKAYKAMIAQMEKTPQGLDLLTDEIMSNLGIKTLDEGVSVAELPSRIKDITKVVKATMTNEYWSEGSMLKRSINQLDSLMDAEKNNAKQDSFNES